MPTQSSSPHLSFGENKNAEWYGILDYEGMVHGNGRQFFRSAE
jgi:hypothetical protein